MSILDSVRQKVEQEIKKRALSVSPAKPTQTISGVVSAAPKQTISGVTQAQPQGQVRMAQLPAKETPRGPAPVTYAQLPSLTAQHPKAQSTPDSLAQIGQPSALDTLKQFPEGLSKVSNDIVPMFTRGAANLTLSAAKGEQKLRGKIFGSDSVTYRAPETLSTEGPLQPLFGKEDIKGETAYGKEVLPKFAEKGPLPLLAGLTMSALDFTGTGGSKGAIKALVAAKDEAQALKILKKLNVAGDIAKIYATKLAETTNPEVIGNLLKNIEKVQGTTKLAKPAASVLEAPKPPKITSVTRDIGETNLERLNVSDIAKQNLKQGYQEVKTELENIRGKKMTHKEIAAAAKDGEALEQIMTKEESLKFNAAALNARQKLARLAEGEVTPELLQALKVDSTNATDIGRSLEARKIRVGNEAVDLKLDILKRLEKTNATIEDIVKKAKGIDFSNVNDVDKFYREFVKPSAWEMLQEYRYANLLSSPKTHAVNLLSGLAQGLVLNPTTRLATGALDTVAAALTGKARTAYAGEVAPYFKGMFSHIPEALRNATDALSGKSLLKRPDLERIGTNAKILKPFKYVGRAMEAADVFVRGMIEAGEKEARVFRAAKSGSTKSAENILKEAKDAAEYWIFRQGTDSINASQQGKVLSALDSVTELIYSMRKKPHVGKLISWFIPFVQTPMNILKQGIEFSPLGFSTIRGASNKTEQLAKALVGSSVFAGAGYLGLQDRLTWSAPTGDKQKEIFYASGRQPYSVKIGNKWVSFSRIGPLAYPMAMAAALQWNLKENPKSVTRSNMEKTTRALGGITEFFSDQSYMEGISQLTDLLTDTERALPKVATNVPGQLVPLAGLQRWTAQLIDPIYRKPEKGLSVEAIIQNLQADIPGASKSLPAYTDPLGRPSKRQLPILNAFNPAPITQSQPLFETMLKAGQAGQRVDAIKQEIKDKIQKAIDKRLSR